jgi:hypothetical protein
MKMNKDAIIYTVLVLIGILSIWNTTTLGTVAERTDGRIDNLNGRIMRMQEHTHYDPVDKELDSFNSVFRYNYNKYGEGHLFEWNNGVYTTDIEKEEEIIVTRIQ